MKQRMLKVFRVFGVLSLVFVSTLVASQGRAAEAIPGEYLVKYRDNAFLSLMSVRSMAAVRVMDHNSAGNLIKVQVAPSNEVAALARLLKNPNVEYVVPNVKLHAFTTPVDTKALKEQWALAKVNAEAAWQKAGRGSRNILVAVIDTGADYNHESLKGNMIPGFDFRENDEDPYDKTSAQNPGHGTHCSGIIGGSGLVDGGIVGMSPEVSIMPIRFLGEDGSGDLNAAIKAIDYALEKGVKVISASWGATVKRAQAQPLVEAIQRASDKGVIFVAAAANDGKSNDKTEVYPANSGFANTITVAASDPNDAKPQWSNYGRKTVHLAAPGLNIMSTLPENKYGNLSGTSMATPLVSGLVALLLSTDPNLSGAQARAVLQHTGAKVQIETACNCRVDAAAAVDLVMAKKMYIVPAAASLAIDETVTFTAPNGKAPFEYTVGNASVGTITPEGLFTAKTEGETTVSVKDADGNTSTSLAILVGGAKSSEPPPGNGMECPMEDPQMCDLLCQLDPTLPWCN